MKQVADVFLALPFAAVPPILIGLAQQDQALDGDAGAVVRVERNGVRDMLAGVLDDGVPQLGVGDAERDCGGDEEHRRDQEATAISSFVRMCERALPCVSALMAVRGAVNDVARSVLDVAGELAATDYEDLPRATTTPPSQPGQRKGSRGNTKLRRAHFGDGDLPAGASRWSSRSRS